MQNKIQDARIERWLQPSDPSRNYNKAMQQRHKGSGIWFLQHDAFNKWMTHQNSFLWPYGIPGCGKTILASTIIEHLERTVPRQSLLYFYFDFSDIHKQTLEKMIRSFVSQLSYKHEHIAQQLHSIFSSCEDGRQQPTIESLCEFLLSSVEQVSEVWVVIDALDECSTRAGVLAWIRDILASEGRNVHLLVTSRQEQDIESSLSEFTCKDDMIPIQNNLTGGDIRAYIHARIREDEAFKRWGTRPDIQDEIETRLSKKADGMLV